MHLLRHLGLAAALLLAPLAAFAQSSILSTGLPVRGHVVVFQSGGTNGVNPVASDAGAVGAPNVSAPITDLPIVAPGSPVCIYDAAISSSVGYHKLCIGANSSGSALISVDAFGGATPIGLNFEINGNTYPFPGSGGNGNVIGPNSSTVGHLAMFNSTDGKLLGDYGSATLAVANGGTGAVTLTAHGVLVGEGTSAVIATTAGTSGFPLVAAGASADPTFQALDLTVGVTGILPMANFAASPTFTGVTTTGNASIGGTFGVTGNTGLTGALAVTGVTALTGAVTFADTLGRDAQFFLELNGSNNPQINFNLNSFMYYDRGTSRFYFVTGNVIKFSIDSAGNITATGCVNYNGGSLGSCL